MSNNESVGRSASSHQQKVLGPFTRLVVVGESNVRGGAWLDSHNERWADILWHLLECSQETPLEYINAGVGACVISPRSPGYAASTKPSIAERLDSDVISHAPDLVVVACGMNDMRSGIDPGDFAHEMCSILARLQQSLSALVVVSSMYYLRGFHYFPPFDKGSIASATKLNSILHDLAGKMGCVYADIWSAQGQCDHVIHSDTVHLNKIGNLLTAHKVFEAVVHAAYGISTNVIERDERSEWTQKALERRLIEREASHAIGSSAAATPGQ